MALIENIGRSANIIYGTSAKFTFDIRFPSASMESEVPLNTQAPMLPKNMPVAGTITVAGASVTLTSADIITPAHVATKIKTSGVSGYTVSINEKNPAQVILVATAIGSIARPTVVLNTAKNILFVNTEFINGVACPSGNLDDIFVGGRTPVTLTLSTANVTATVASSTGSLAEQRAGTLTYGTNLTFTGGTITLTAPVNFVRVATSGVGATSVAKLYITR